MANQAKEKDGNRIEENIKKRGNLDFNTALFSK